MTIDQIGNIHDNQGRFDGHLRSDAESTLVEPDIAAAQQARANGEKGSFAHSRSSDV